MGQISLSDTEALACLSQWVPLRSAQGRLGAVRGHVSCLNRPPRTHFPGTSAETARVSSTHACGGRCCVSRDTRPRVHSNAGLRLDLPARSAAL